MKRGVTNRTPKLELVLARRYGCQPRGGALTPQGTCDPEVMPHFRPDPKLAAMCRDVCVVTSL
jgi:hypothetical protein